MRIVVNCISLDQDFTQLQRGENLSLPRSLSMPAIGAHCHELRIQDQDKSWRIVYRIDCDAIVILEVFRKTTQHTPLRVIEDCKRRLKQYEATQSSRE